MDLPNEAIEEIEPTQGHVRNQLECQFPANRKRPRTSLADSGRMAAGISQDEAKATDCCSSVENDDDRDEEDPKPSLVTSSAARISSDASGQDIVQEEATSGVIPAGWTRTKLEPDW